MSTHTADWRAFHTSDQLARDSGGDPTKRRPKKVPVLDYPCEAHPILNLLMGEALTRILLTADGATMALQAVRVRSGKTAGHRAPVSVLSGDVDALRDRYERAGTNRRRLGVIRDAQEAARKLAYAPDRSMVRNTREWREKIAADPRSFRVVAQVFGVSHMTVSRIKKQVG